jgi:outer membrane protein OmpA-like peptidoglycan-associated protein
MNELIHAVAPDSQNILQPALKVVECCSIDDLNFGYASSFINPTIQSKMSDLAGLIQQYPPPSKVAPPQASYRLSIFGHADPVGNDDYNKKLSGRRAMAIYALLTRRSDLWDRLYSDPFGKDRWGDIALKKMLDMTSSQSKSDTEEYENNIEKRKRLFETYMDVLCGKELKFLKEDFLCNGDDAEGKGDYQGCGEFNPILIFSEENQKTYEKDDDKTKRDKSNEPNRRVKIMIFEKTVRVDPSRWPCPRISEGFALCEKQFWSDGERRRTRRVHDKDRTFGENQDTFACRFYQSQIIKTSFEEVKPLTKRLKIRLVDNLFKPLNGVSGLIVVNDDVEHNIKAKPMINFQTNDNGMLEVDVPSEWDQAYLFIDSMFTEEPYEIVLKLTEYGTLDEISGARARLTNLGYLSSSEDSKLETNDSWLSMAIDQFRSANGIVDDFGNPKGMDDIRFDGKTKNKIWDLHDKPQSQFPPT